MGAHLRAADLYTVGSFDPYGRIGTCWQPRVKGYTVMVNSIYNGSRFEDLWLDD